MAWHTEYVAVGGTTPESLSNGRDHVNTVRGRVKRFRICLILMLQLTILRPAACVDIHKVLPMNTSLSRTNKCGVRTHKH